MVVLLHMWACQSCFKTESLSKSQRDTRVTDDEPHPRPPRQDVLEIEVKLEERYRK